VGLSFVGALQALQEEGHELGLHGGMDHVVWSRRFHQLPDEDLRADIDESYGHFVRHFGRPTGFSSPGFYSDERVMAQLDHLGFLYNGDAIGGEPARATADGRELRHWTIPVTLSGPRTIPFLEYHGARGTPDDQVIAELHRHLDERDQVILYGHPCYEGVRESVLRKVFGAVLERGYRFVTLQTIARRLQSGALV
jgi:peptidoglycan/xylan/chitin deacetylase (PgdA/CDA1 family)